MNIGIIRILEFSNKTYIISMNVYLMKTVFEFGGTITNMKTKQDLSAFNHSRQGPQCIVGGSILRKRNQPKETILQYYYCTATLYAAQPQSLKWRQQQQRQ